MSLQIQQLAFERHYDYLFYDINCELHSGELLQVIGENGSGKTTLLRILAGLLQPESGNVLWQGESIFSDKETYLQQLNYIGHQNGIKPYLTVMENLNLFSVLTKKNKLLIPAIEILGLQAILYSQANALSAGQKRRLALARLILNPASLWILDEPTNALDMKGQTLFFNLLAQHLNQGGMAVITSHHDIPKFKLSKILSLENYKDDTGVSNV